LSIVKRSAKLGPVVATLSLVDDLVGVAEIAEALGVSRQRVHQLTKLEGFPEPVAVLSAGTIWTRREVEAWAKQTGRL
jgi:predicted DNA-binding transcriptional regulator AlpA